jgi:hypothetical protein
MIAKKDDGTAGADKFEAFERVCSVSYGVAEAYNLIDAFLFDDIECPGEGFKVSVDVGYDGETLWFHR